MKFKKPKNLSKNLSKNLLWAFLAFLLISALLSFFSMPSEKSESVTLSQVAQQVNEDKVKEIIVEGNDLTVILKEADKKEKTRKENEASLTESLKNYGVDSEKLRNVSITIKEPSGAMFWLGTLLPFLLPFLFIGILIWFMLRQAQRGSMQAFSFIKTKAKMAGSGEKVTFANVAGLKEAKEELKEIVDFLKHPKKFLDIGAKIPRGVLLMGPPGTGKTLLARATSGEAGVPFFHISGSEFVEMFVGVGASIRGDELVLVRQDGKTRLAPIKEIVDGYYQANQGDVVVSVSGLETLGVTKKETNFRGFKNNKDKFLFGGSQWTQVKGVYRHKAKEIYEIHYRGGKIETTGDHSVFIREKNYVRAKRVDELEPGEALANLPFKTRSVFLPGIGTTHNVRGHQFENYQPIKLVVWQENAELLEKYQLIMANRNLVSQFALAETAGVSQTTVGEWQRGEVYPRELSFKVFKSRVYVPREVDATPDLMRLLGYYTAEGRKTTYFTQFVFGVHEKELHDDCISLMKNIFNIDPHLDRTPDNTLRITYHSKEIGEFFEKHCGTGSHRKRLPEFIWELSYAHVREYVKGYGLGDGYHTTDGKLSITSVSEQLIRELSWLLAMHGIQAGVRKMKAPAGRVIKNKPLPETISWNLIIGKTSNIWSEERIKSPNQFKKPIVTKIIKKEYDGYVYDFCGCDNEAFFAGRKPILVHNSRVRDTFATAKKNAPSILFIDELDAIGRHRGAGLGGGHDEREQTLNQILVEMDGFDRDTNVIVMAATNRPDILDPALLRPGRFDRRVILDEPDINDREQILKIHAKGKPLTADVNLRRVAERTPGFSGADLANIMNEAAIFAARQNKTVIAQEDILESIEKVLLGPERKSHILSTQEKEITAYHEAGHALVTAILPGTDPVHKVSIISRGRAGGYTLKLPTEDRHLHTRTQFINDLSIMLGGYAAEKIIFKELTTGASSDLQKTTDLARRLVTQFGMSERLGPMTFGHKEELVFLGKEIHESRNYSETVAFEIDKEVRKMIFDAYRVAQQVIRENKPKLDKIAKTLIEKETLEKEAFEALMRE